MNGVMTWVVSVDETWIFRQQLFNNGMCKKIHSDMCFRSRHLNYCEMGNAEGCFWEIWQIDDSTAIKYVMSFKYLGMNWVMMGSFWVVS